MINSILRFWESSKAQRNLPNSSPFTAIRHEPLTNGFPTIQRSRRATKQSDISGRGRDGLLAVRG